MSSLRFFVAHGLWIVGAATILAWAGYARHGGADAQAQRITPAVRRGLVAGLLLLAAGLSLRESAHLAERIAWAVLVILELRRWLPALDQSRRARSPAD